MLEQNFYLVKKNKKQTNKQTTTAPLQETDFKKKKKKKKKNWLIVQILHIGAGLCANEVRLRPFLLITKKAT